MILYLRKSNDIFNWLIIRKRLFFNSNNECTNSKNVFRKWLGLEIESGQDLRRLFEVIIFSLQKKKAEICNRANRLTC